ncbi:MAG: universal stress protein [Candidatus Dormiibacterota bacterium]
MIQRILLAADRSYHCRRAAANTSELAAKLGAEVLVVHVQEWPAQVPASAWVASDEATQLVETLRGHLEADGVRARAEIRDARRGHLAEELLAAADAYGADLISMGAKGESDIRALLLGSVAHKVLQLARCPVLVERR